MTSEWHRGWLGRGVGSVYVGPGGWHRPRQQTTQEATPRGATSRGPTARRTPSSSGHLVGKVPRPPRFLFYSVHALCRHCMNRLPSLSSVPHWSAQVLSAYCVRGTGSPRLSRRGPRMCSSGVLSGRHKTAQAGRLHVTVLEAADPRSRGWQGLPGFWMAAFPLCPQAAGPLWGQERALVSPS